jgi:hypothetical protein
MLASDDLARHRAAMPEATASQDEVVCTAGATTIK